PAGCSGRVCPIGWAGFSASALIMGENPTRASPENLSPTNEAEITRGRPTGTTSAKVLWVPFFQERYGSIRVDTNNRRIKKIKKGMFESPFGFHCTTHSAIACAGAIVFYYEEV
ncbi:hypothetical protein, partial [uncultured Rikenella sp.]|uniref:hypothetical protein n=1 Tax=uncultured Rikenella sp. TaxID=368003 RepID=UPI002615606F